MGFTKEIIDLITSKCERKFEPFMDYDEDGDCLEIILSPNSYRNFNFVCF